MVRIFGIFVIFTASAFLGFYKANLLNLRQNKLLEICFFIEAAADRIRLSEEMGRIVEQCGKKAGVYKDGLCFCINEEYLNPGDIKLANSFLNGLGMGDVKAEIKRCESYKELFKKEHQKAEIKTKEKASLYKKLGIFLGMLISIVLI